MELDLFAGIPVRDYAAARPWFEQLFGEVAFEAHETECVWEVAEHRYVFIVEDAERAGGGVVTLFAEDLEAAVEAIAGRGLEPAKRETYNNGVRKATYRDADGNEIGFGGAPLGD